MADALELDIAGERVRLLADGALHWPARDRLLIADLHLGKGDTFRAAGIAVPSGGTAHDLARLDALLTATGAASLWILGDFLHARHHAAVDTAWRRFRDGHRAVAFAVIPGNHDRALDARAADVQVLEPDVRDGPFRFRHMPPATLDPRHHVICGHLHPVIRLPGAGRHRLFWLTPGRTVLPAYSAFAGGWAVAPRDAAGSVLCDGRDVLRLAPPPAAR